MAFKSVPQELASPPRGGQKKPVDEFMREELLWRLRVRREANHRIITHLRGVTYIYQPAFSTEHQ